MSVPNSIKIDGVEFVRADSVVPAPPGKRAVVVVDRGWIFAGDVDESTPGRVKLTRAVWVFSWASVGFAAVVADPKKSKADIRPLSTVVDLPADSEIFRLPVGDDWGL